MRLSRILEFLIFFLLAACTPQAASRSLGVSGAVLPSPAAVQAAAVGQTASPSPSPSPFALTPTLTLSPTSTPSLIPTASSTPSPTSPPVTRLLFTGVIVPARCVQAAIDERGDHDYIYAEVQEIIQGADLAVGTFNATMSDIPVHTGCVRTYLLVGDPENADALARAGFDLMSVATNHIKNCGVSRCGDQAFFDTLANLRRVGILPVGAGETYAQAMEPVVVMLNGVRFGFVSLGQIEPTTFAAEDTPGIAVLNQANLEAAITAARQVSDVVIVMPHWGPEDSPVPGWIQRNLAQQAVAAGADLVVGNHTHVVQAAQEITGVPVFYGLGNFVFDQSLEDHQQGVILVVNFVGKRYAGYEFIPTHVDGDGTVHLAGPQEAAQILERIAEASRAVE